jgi:hypothetical protein
MEHEEEREPPEEDHTDRMARFDIEALELQDFMARSTHKQFIQKEAA